MVRLRPPPAEKGAAGPSGPKRFDLHLDYLDQPMHMHYLNETTTREHRHDARAWTLHPLWDSSLPVKPLLKFFDAFSIRCL